jgi:DNA-binding transcriptional regulator YiaG
VELGEWLTPSPALRDDATAEEIAAWHAAVSRGLSAERVAEVASGTWRNPALDPAAREKLSTPRRHDGVLASAIEKLGRGIGVADLTPDEREAHRSYRRELAASHHDDPATSNARLRAARQAAGLSQQDLAAAVGVSHTTVSQWERLGLRPRDPDVRRAVEELLGTANLWPKDGEMQDNVSGTTSA